MIRGITLEEAMFREARIDFGITKDNAGSMDSYLQILRNRHEGTYLHSLRVATLSATIAQYAKIPGVTPKMMLWAGALHDIGKALIDTALLKKTNNFTEDDRVAMIPHVEYGFKMLRGVHDVSAYIMVRHHRYGRNPYPSLPPPFPDILKNKADAILDASRLLAMADYYDAITTRKNDKFGSVGLSKGAKKELFHRDHNEFKPLIQILENVEVFTYECRASE